MPAEGSEEIRPIAQPDQSSGTIVESRRDKAAMTLRKRRIVLYAIPIVVVCLAILWFGLPATIPVRLAFVHATDLPSGTILGVFQLQNELNEDIEIDGAVIEENKDGHWAIVRTTTPQGADHCPGRTNILLAIRMPTKGGSFRLGVRCIPISKLTPKYYHSLRYRIAVFASGHRLIRPLWFGGRRNATYAEWHLHGIMVIISAPFSAATLHTNPKPLIS
jgi:hypothetical protein